MKKTVLKSQIHVKKKAFYIQKSKKIFAFRWAPFVLRLAHHDQLLG